MEMVTKKKNKSTSALSSIYQEMSSKAKIASDARETKPHFHFSASIYQDRHYKSKAASNKKDSAHRNVEEINI